MKKLLIAATLVFAFAGFSYAQQGAPATAKKQPVNKEKQTAKVENVAKHNASSPKKRTTKLHSKKTAKA
jgi:hypothetical protein